MKASPQRSQPKSNTVLWILIIVGVLGVLFFAVISDDGLFLTTPNEGMKYRDVVDGLANTLLAVELPNRSAEWSSTENLTPDQAYAAITSLEPQQVAFLVMGDASVLFVRKDLERATFDAMVTRAGGEVFVLPERQR